MWVRASIELDQEKLGSFLELARSGTARYRGLRWVWPVWPPSLHIDTRDVPEVSIRSLCQSVEQNFFEALNYPRRILPRRASCVFNYDHADDARPASNPRPAKDAVLSALFLSMLFPFNWMPRAECAWGLCVALPALRKPFLAQVIAINRHHIKSEGHCVLVIHPTMKRVEIGDAIRAEPDHFSIEIALPSILRAASTISG
jgi:hypothetical protein